MSEMLREGSEKAVTPESAKGGGVGAWLRNAAATLLGRGKAEKIHAWPGVTLYSRGVEIKITDMDGGRGFFINSPSGFVSTKVTVDSDEEFAQVKAILTNLSDVEQVKFAFDLRYSNDDDSKLDDMRGAAGLMQDAFYKMCKENIAE